MPKEDEIHQCELLERENRYLDFVGEGKHYARWRLIVPKNSTEKESDQVYMQHVLFCPGCGKDLRADFSTDVWGEPGLSKLLRKLGCGEAEPDKSGPMYIYQSTSYTSYSYTPPTEEQIGFVKRKDGRILKVEGGKMYGLRRDGTWKHAPDGQALRQVLSAFGGLVEEQQE